MTRKRLVTSFNIIITICMYGFVTYAGIMTVYSIWVGEMRWTSHITKFFSQITGLSIRTIDLMWSVPVTTFLIIFFLIFLKNAFLKFRNH